MTDDAVRYARSGGRVAYRVVGSGPWVAWVPGTIAGCAATIVTVHGFSSRRPGSLVPFGRVCHRDAIEETWGRGAARWWMKRSPPASHAFLNENQTTTCSRSRAPLRLTSKGSLMPDSTQSSDGVITKPSSKSVAQTIDGLRRVIADRGFTVFNVIDHRGVAERAGVQMPDSKPNELVCRCPTRNSSCSASRLWARG